MSKLYQEIHYYRYKYFHGGFDYQIIFILLAVCAFQLKSILDPGKVIYYKSSNKTKGFYPKAGSCLLNSYGDK